MEKTISILLGLFLVLCAVPVFAQTQIEPAKPQKPTVVPGKQNAITDVPGIEVGHYDRNDTGTTVILARKGVTGGVEVRGSAPGTRETDLLNPTNLVDKVFAVVLTGGSAYGLATADGVMLWLEENKLGWPVGGGEVVPIVPAAVLYDPGRFGRTFRDRPTSEFGRKACENASSGPVAMGNVGAGAGAMSGGIKGGLGTASVDLGNGVIVGAIVALNSNGSTINPETGEFYAKFLELNGEFGGLKPPFSSAALPTDGTTMQASNEAGEPAKNTTIAVVATNVQLTKAQARKIAEMAHDGMGRAIRPAHTMFDGDTIFSLATGELDLGTLKQEAAWGNMAANVNKIGSAAADALARAIVHAMLNAQTIGAVPCYRDKYPGAFKK
jgi:L-aminopeptidase/D-esterase-like protein